MKTKKELIDLLIGFKNDIGYFSVPVDTVIAMIEEIEEEIELSEKIEVIVADVLSLIDDGQIKDYIGDYTFELDGDRICVDDMDFDTRTFKSDVERSIRESVRVLGQYKI